MHFNLKIFIVCSEIRKQKLSDKLNKFPNPLITLFKPKVSTRWCESINQSIQIVIDTDMLLNYPTTPVKRGVLLLLSYTFSVTNNLN